MITIKLFTLFGEVFLKSNEAEKGLTNIDKKAQSTVDKLSKLEKATGKAGEVMTKWVTGPIVGLAGGLTAIIKKTADYGDQMQKMALRTGFSTEALSEYKHAAELSGSSIETVEKGVKKMQATLFDAEQGLSTATDSLSALGLSFEDLQGLSPEEQFNKLSAAIAEVEDPTKRAALAQEIFGRAGTELLPMFSAGADGIAAMRQEAHDLGIVFDQEAADAAAQFNDDLDRLKKGFAGAFQELGQKLLPIIVDELLPALKEHVIPAVQNFGERIVNLIDWFRNLDPTWQKVIGGAIGLAVAIGPVLVVVSKMIGIVKTIIGLKKVWTTVQTILNAVMSANPIGLVIMAIAALIAIIVLCVKHWDEIVAALGKAWDWIKETAVKVWEEIKNSLALLWENIAEGAISIWERIKDFFGRIWSEIEETAISFWESIKGRLAELWESIVEGAISIWERIKKPFIIIASIITGLVLPKMATLAYQTIISASKVAASWASMAVQATINAVKVVASWASMAVQATVNAAKVAAAWISTAAQATASATVHAVQAVPRVIASFASMVASSAASAAKVVASWVLMGVQSLIHAAKMAAAWVMAMGPVGWIIAAVAGLAAIIILNWDKIKDVTVKVWSAVSDFFINLWDSIKNLFFTVIEWIKDLFYNFTPLGIIIKNWEPIKDFFVNLWNSIVQWVMDKVFSWAITLQNTFTNIKNSVIDAFNNLKNKALEIWGGIWDGIKGFVNKIIDGINSMINGMNKLKFNIPDWDIFGSWAGKTFGLNIPKIPKLAQGGIIRSAGAVLVGEEGPELLHLPVGAQVTPLNETKTVNLNIDFKNLPAHIDESSLLVALIKALRNPTIMNELDVIQNRNLNIKHRGMGVAFA